MKMDRSFANAPRLALAVSTALAGLALTGCMTSAAPPADVSFASAQTALSRGQVDKAIGHAEAAVLADPRNPGFRALLGAAYMDAGRFQSAATSFGDALDLGDDNARTVLSFALAKIASGEGRAAVSVLDEYGALIDPTDLGLALALSGQPERGVGVLINAVRGTDEASPKLRQNLAYAYALAGNWRAARVMAAEDVPADQVDQRLTQWAAMAAPEQFQQRVAVLLDVTPRSDTGQPQQLALANFPAKGAMFAEAAQQAPVAMAAASPTENPVSALEPYSPPTFAQAFTAPAPSIQSVEPATPGVRFVSKPMVQQLPARSERPAQRMAVAAPQRRMAPATGSAPVASDKGAATHLVQLGSYNNKVEAERGWATLKSQFPQLKNHKVVVTEAVVNGRTFWRVAADGFGPKSAQSLCGTVKSSGRGCFAYAASSPPAGAVKRDVQMASRMR